MRFERNEIEQLLSNHYVYESKIKKLSEQIEILEARATKKTTSYSQDQGSTPITNPKPSKVEKNAIKLAECKKIKEDFERLYDYSTRMYHELRPHQRYMIRCVKANKIPYKEFAKQQELKPAHVKSNVDRCVKRLASMDW